MFLFDYPHFWAGCPSWRLRSATNDLTYHLNFQFQAKCSGSVFNLWWTINSALIIRRIKGAVRFDLCDHNQFCFYFINDFKGASSCACVVFWTSIVQSSVGFNTNQYFCWLLKVLILTLAMKWCLIPWQRKLAVYNMFPDDLCLGECI